MSTLRRLQAYLIWLLKALRLATFTIMFLLMVVIVAPYQRFVSHTATYTEGQPLLFIGVEAGRYRLEINYDEKSHERCARIASYDITITDDGNSRPVATNTSSFPCQVRYSPFDLKSETSLSIKLQQRTDYLAKEVSLIVQGLFQRFYAWAHAMGETMPYLLTSPPYWPAWH